IYLGDRASSVRAQLIGVQKKLDALGPIDAQVKQLEQTVAVLQARQAALKQLLTNQLPASESLEAIKTVIPRDVWLVNVSTQGGHNVLFDGSTFSYKSVARFMVALRDSERFRNIDLTSTQKDRVGQREVVKFSVTGELVTGPTKGRELVTPTAGAWDTPTQPVASHQGTPSPGRISSTTGDPQ
ncbi:MAG TPA: PilN domain-containing protein, partial [bacterium]|nr:PilN domain-containing protein [bacterium]